MTHQAELQRRILDEVSHYAPTLDVIKTNDRATAEWERQSKWNPVGIEAQGLEDIQELQKQLLRLYWCNTLNGDVRGMSAGLL